MPLVSQAEEEILDELDRLVSFWKERGENKKIVITQKQFNTLRRIEKKAEKGPLMRRYGELKLSHGFYNGVEFEVKKPLRPSRRKKDTQDMFT